MGEFASKGVAGTGLGLGIAGTALGVLAGSNDGNGLLGGLFGNGGNKLSALMSENAMLKSENYSDKVAKDVYGQSLTDNRRLRDELYVYIKPLADEAASNRERVAVLEAQQQKNGEIADLREKLVRSELGARIDAVAAAATCGINGNSAAIAALQNTVNGITRTVIPRTAICPEVMERWNSWVAPTNQAPATQPITGTVNVKKG